MVKEKLTKYFNEINDKTFKSLGLEWYMVENHYWVEMRVISNYKP